MDDALDAIRQACELIRDMGPFPVAIWIVDRPGLLHRVVELRNTYARPTDPPPMFGTGIPIYEWHSWVATDEEYQRAPWFVRIPGVWFQMSDHRSIRMDM